MSSLKMDCGIITNGLTKLREFSNSFEENLCHESPDDEFSCLCEDNKSSDTQKSPTDDTTEVDVGCCSRFMNRRAGPHEAYVPTRVEHIANVVSHGIAVIPSIYCLGYLSEMAVTNSQYYNGLVFGLAVTTLFSMSFFYHSVSFWGKYRLLRLYSHKLDRAVIYIFIASSYSPWLNLRDIGGLAAELRWLVWLLAFIGIAYQCCYHEKYKIIESLLYLFVGIFPAVSVLFMRELSGLPLLAFGGLMYITGMVFFKMDGLVPCAHAIWHIHVVIGATCHYYAVCVHLLGPTSSEMEPMDSMQKPLNSLDYKEL